MLDIAGLLGKHRGKGVFVDANLMVLLLVGSVNRQRIRTFKRTSDFTVEDYDRLVRLVGWFGTLIATPHILSQVSDLADLPGRELSVIRERFKLVVESVDEFYDQSRTLVGDSAFKRLGLADVAVAKVCSRGILVLTDDVALYAALQARDLDSLNFTHIRAMGW